MKLLDRAQLMDLMLFPQNTKQMVIVPSNKEGTGFLNHCFEPKYSRGFLSEMEFNAIVLISSRIAATQYSKKQIIDRQNITPFIWLLIKAACGISLTGILVQTISVIYEWSLIETIASFLVLPSMLVVAGLNFYVWRRAKPDRVTFDKLVSEELNLLFDKINSFYA